MRKKTPRAICVEVLNRVKEAGAHPDILLTDSFKRYRHLTPLDRAFLTELIYGVLRWRGKLDWIIRHYSKIPLEKIEPEILNILRLGFYQIEFLSKTPSSAAVNESVELAKKIRGQGGAGFVNAILRSAIRERGEISYPDFDQDPVLQISVVQSHPAWLVERWVREMGVEQTRQVCATNNRIGPLILRTNTLKMGREDLIEKLTEQGLKPSPTPFSEEGIVLREPPPISELPFLKEGLYIIQDEASQLVTSILDPKPGERILDACAAPGGKTTHIAQKMGDRGEVYALDLSMGRLYLIEGTCRRLGIRIVRAVRGDATRPLPVSKGLAFDRVLADVPCSGFGTLKRNPDLKWRKGKGDIERLSELQYSILTNVSRYVNEKGILVYSTCTVFHEENEDVVEKFLREHSEFRVDPVTDVLPEECHPFVKNGYFKTFPPQNDMDGFFVVRMIKTSSHSSS